MIAIEREIERLVKLCTNMNHLIQFRFQERVTRT